MQNGKRTKVAGKQSKRKAGRHTDFPVSDVAGVVGVVIGEGTFVFLGV